MKAAVIEAVGRLVVRDLPMPEPGEHQALCELVYGAVCAGTDSHLVGGSKPFCSWFQMPAILGHESIGRVVKLGAKVRHLKVGDLVTRVGTPPVGGVNIAWGGFAEFGIASDWRAMLEDGANAAQVTFLRVQQVLPAGTDPAAATMLITWRETWSWLCRLGLRPGLRVCIAGSGGNGFSFAAHARNLGCEVTVLGSANRADIAGRLGVSLIDYRAADAAQRLKTCAGAGFELVVDAVGRPSAIEPVLPMLAPDAILGIYGLDEVADYRLNPLAAPGRFSISGMGGYDEAEAHDTVMRFWGAGLLDARDFLGDLGKPYALADINDALTAVRERRALKTLVRLRG